MPSLAAVGTKRIATGIQCWLLGAAPCKLCTSRLQPRSLTLHALPLLPPPRSRTFQRFAIRSNAMMQDMAKKSAEQKAQLGQTAVEKGGHFWKV